MGSTFKRSSMLVIAVLFGASAAAQERMAGPRLIELQVLPGGGVFFTESSDGASPFTNYLFGGSATYNLNNRVGVEVEAGFGIGHKETVTYQGETLVSQPMPDTITYTGNVVLNLRSPHHLMPYVTGGLGAFEIIKREGTAAIGITANKEVLTSNVGGGLKWYSGGNWGVRGDYRILIVPGTTETPEFFGGTETRYGHRISAGIFAVF